MQTTKKTTGKNPKESGPLINLLFSIVVPVIILNKLSGPLGENGPLIALIIALAFPIGLGLYDLIRAKKANFFSILGIVSVLLTGGLALLQVEGEWFALKEASIPLILGLFVLGSAFSKKNVLELMFFNEKFIELELIKERLIQQKTKAQFQKHLKISTALFAVSFFFSATMNYVLASNIFTKIDPNLDELVKATLLNDQIAQMTWKGYVIIMIPSIVFLFFLFWYLFRGVNKMTGLTIEEVVKKQ